MNSTGSLSGAATLINIEATLTQYDLMEFVRSIQAPSLGSFVPSEGTIIGPKRLMLRFWFIMRELSRLGTRIRPGSSSEVAFPSIMDAYPTAKRPDLRNVVYRE